MTDIAYRTADVDGLTVFYREAGPTDAPVLVLLGPPGAQDGDLPFGGELTVVPPRSRLRDTETLRVVGDAVGSPVPWKPAGR